MTETGVVRKIDPLGRFVLPAEIRRQFAIRPGDAVEYFIATDKIVIRKYEFSCLFCASTTGITKFKGKAICYKCRIAMENSYV